MEGRGLTLAAVLLLGVVGVTFAGLHRENRRGMLDRARDQGDRSLSEAAGAVGLRVRAAEEAMLALAEAASLRALCGEASPAERAGAFATFDQLVGRLAQDERLGLVSVAVETGAGPLAGYSAGGRSWGALRPAPGASLLEAAGGGVRRRRLAVIEVEGAPVVVAATETAEGARVLVGARFTAAASRCEAAAGDGSWALVAGDQVVWPPGAGVPPSPPPGEGRAALVDDAVLGAVSIVGAPWQLRVRAPLSDELVGSPVPLILAGFAACLVGWLGLRGARAVALQHSLSESQRHERQLQAIFDAIANVLVVVDPGLRVIRANKVAAERLGGDPVGRGYGEAILAGRVEDPAAELAALRGIFGSGEHRQVELTTPTGEVWQVAQFPIFAPDLSVRGVVEHARDVTHTRHLQTQLVQSEKLATLGEMAAGIAHEINNPIGVVSMFAELLGEEIRETLGEESPALEKVGMIEEQATNVGEIVKGLLRFARKSEGVKARFSVAAAVERALTIVTHQKLLAEVALERDGPSPSPEVLGDEGQLAQVILNLVVNGCHAMEGQGTLGLTVVRRGPQDPPPPGRPFGQTDGWPRRVDVRITDSGKGIPPEVLDRIFEPFFTTKPAGAGTGLGLSVGFGIIRDHGGCIWVHSAPGEGTTFTLDLPEASAPDGATGEGERSREEET
jgi:signal transduction histidine kinase